MVPASWWLSSTRTTRTPPGYTASSVMVLTPHYEGGEARGDDQRDSRGKREPADHGDCERALELGAGADAERERREPGEGRARGHEHGAEAAARRGGDR